jgi:hypothetical protein
MLRLLAGLSPVLVIVLGAIPAGAAGWFARDALFEWFDRPAIVRAATASATQAANDACTIRTMDAANRAEAAERARQRLVGEKALAGYEHALELEERLRKESQGQFDEEIKDYEQQLSEAGRRCDWSERDLEWLREEPGLSPPDGGG